MIVRKLYDEHYRVLAVIVSLQKLTDQAIPSDDQVGGWKESLEVGRDHAATCGSLC